MNCNEIENRFPAYLEGLLSPEESREIAGHLSSCAQCSRALTDLKKTQEIVNGLDEVEPPPFFEQRIMARVREEAGRKQSILWRLFYPLHIKIPIQALATILIAVLAFQIYQTNEPEMKQAVPLPLPVTEQAKDRVAVETPMPASAPPAAALIAQRSAGNLSRKDERHAPPPFKSGGAEKEMTASQAPAPKESPAAAESAAPAVAKAEKETFSAGSSKVQEGTVKQDADHTLESLPPERKQKMMAAGTGATAGESRKAVVASSSLRQAKGTAIKTSVMDLTVEVGDTADAIRKIEARLAQIHARIVERGRRDGGEFLKAEVPARDIAAFLEGLKTIGRVNVATQPPTVPTENVTVNIKITGRP
jgi:hypothetical protein